MLFKRDLALKIIEGKKTQTIRKRSWYKVGKIYKVNIGPRPAIAEIMITEKREITLKELTDEDAIREGFENLEELKKYWTKTLKQEWNENEKYYAYKFKVIKIMKNPKI